MSTQSNTCPCPQGTLPDGNGNCVSTSISPATSSGTLYPVICLRQQPNYSYQTNFYADISSVAFPITISATSSSGLADASNNPLTIQNTTSGSVWGTTVTCNNCYPGTVTWNGRLNCCGVWTGITGPCASGGGSIGEDCPLHEWIGFSTCINVVTSKTYYIGIGADNAFRIFVNGVKVVEAMPGGFSSFLYLPPDTWNVFPITLPVGNNIIVIEGQNYGLTGALGAEIYDVPSLASLVAVPSIVALTAVTIFSTANLIGQNFQTGQYSGYTCNNGCLLNLCNPLLPVCTCTTIIPIPPCCFKLTNCISGAVIITSADLSGSIGAVVNIAEQSGCWTVTTANTCVGSVPTITVTRTYGGSCNECLPCYILTNCAAPSQIISTSTNLSPYVGSVVQIAGYPNTCWTVSTSSACKTLTPVQVTNTFVDCTSCLCLVYLLTDCSGINPPIITKTNLSAYVGQVVQIKSCADVCWQVSCSSTDTGAVDVVFIKSFDTCILCNPPIPTPTPELLHQRKVRPGYNTPGCSPEYTEKINCKFSEQVFNQIKSRRYGIKTCCEDDLQRYYIKKQMLDLRAIWDPTLCVTCSPISCCTPCPVVVPIPPIPLICPLPTNVVVTINIITPCEDVVGVNGAQIIFNKPTG